MRGLASYFINAIVLTELCRHYPASAGPLTNTSTSPLFQLPNADRNALLSCRLRAPPGALPPRPRGERSPRAKRASAPAQHALFVSPEVRTQGRLFSFSSIDLVSRPTQIE